MANKTQLFYQPDLLNQDAKELSRRHTISHGKKNIIPVKPRLDEARNILTDAYRILATSVKQNQDILPAAEWLIDNFYIVQEQIVEVENSFPVGFQRSIPHLTAGVNKGLPRVYDLVQNLALHTDNVVGVQNLTPYTRSYQENATLKIGELWAIPVMVRLVLVQQLAEKAARVLKRRNVRVNIQKFVSGLAEEQTGEPGWILRQAIEWMESRKDSYEDRLLMTELAHQLQNAGFILEEEKRWFEYRLRAFGTTLTDVLRDEAQRQSKLQVSIQNAIISLREASETKWQDFVEECSVVDQMLRLDPMGMYSEMHSQTKAQYRQVIERLSKHSGASETDIAEHVLLLAEQHDDYTGTSKDDIFTNYDVLKNHVGYFLLGEGYAELIPRIRYRMPIGERVRRVLERTAGWYIGFVTLHTFVLLVILWLFTDAVSHSLPVSLCVLLVSFFPALELSVAAVNRFFAFSLPPRVLPKMEVKDGVPDRARTMVVVPTLLSSTESVRRQLEKLEVTSLANSDPGLQFVLLSDFTDAPKEQMPEDDDIIEEARRIITELNTKYTSTYGNKFFLLHRRRKWNPSEDVWMGWERKRGKLEKLNELLCNADGVSPFSHMFGDFMSTIQGPPVRFVLTLDSDTRTPPDSIADLVGVVSHPLNRAWYDMQKRRITKGYGVIQPRISIPPDSAHKTWFTRIFSGNVGIDPYTTAVSDVYQDLFGEAVFTGKGIYDVRAFHTVLSNRFPENRILSHDLIESNYVRAALSTDIELFDDYPSNYASYCKRNHRWTRGDWQIARWLFRRVPVIGGKEKNPINLLSRWKIFDNLRRSLNPFFLTLFFVTGWFWLPGAAWIWTLAAFGILAFPIYVNFSTDVFNRPARVKWKLYVEKVHTNLKINTFQALSTLAILPHQALIQLDAVGRTLWRLLVSKKRLMEWTSAFQTEQLSHNSVWGYLRSMSVSVLLGAGIVGAAVFIQPADLWIILPFALLWITSPFFAWYLSTPHPGRKNELTEEGRIKLHTYARRTWFYFERLVSEEYSWLPPDNFQEDPPLPPEPRTSPTNIGLTLVSTQAAYEMGYITVSELLTRLECTLDSLTRLERYKGHFYNWYEIRLGEVLSPRYVSTVDSGNLAAGLIVVRQAVDQLWKKGKLNSSFWKGFEDTLFTLKGIISDVKSRVDGFEEIFSEADVCIDRMLDKLHKEVPASVTDQLNLLQSLKDVACVLSGKNLMQLRSILGDGQVDDLLFWFESPLRQIESYTDELKQFGISGSAAAGREILSLSLSEQLQNLENGKGTERSGRYKLLKRWEKQVRTITATSDRLVAEMDFSFLYHKKRGVFSIGYNTETAELDVSTYDLLASEARIASVIAIAKGDVPSEHWFRLGRRLTSRNNSEFLLSWGGTTFEYLMPLLFSRSYPYTLLSHTYECIIDWQRDYARKNGRPWGFSESAYNSLNIHLNYQYKAFGAPGLGLKRGLAEDYVVAPYASVLALMVDPSAALENLENLVDLGGMGLRGYYDAIDFTPERLEESESYKVVRSYMAHHHGMSLIALMNVLNGWSAHHYFHSHPQIKACELLLQERIPQGVPVKEPHPIDVELEPGEQHSLHYVVEHAGITNLDDTPPKVHLLSNGHYHMFISHTGTGSSRYDDVMLTGWKPDTTVDPLGQFVYIRDKETGEYWSAFHQPVRRRPDRYDTWFHNSKIQTSRVDEWIETTTEICVSPEYPVELRKVTLTNYADRPRTLDLTSYAEVVLNQAAAQNSHPAFSRLFVQTDYLAEYHAVIAWRRPRSEEEQPMYVVHTIACDDPEHEQKPLQFETDRFRFIGRGRSLMDPVAMDADTGLSGSTGNISDPILSLRKEVTLGPGEKVQVTFSTGWAASRKEAEELANMFDNANTIERSFNLASVYNTVALEHVGISGGRYQYFQKLAGFMLYNSSRFRAGEEILVRNRRNQSALWPYGISGDNPIMVFRIKQAEQLKSVSKILKGHQLWSHRGLKTDLVILNDHPPSYADELQEGIQQAVESANSSHRGTGEAKVHILRSDRLPREDLILILTVASVVFDGYLPVIDPVTENKETNSFGRGGRPGLYRRASVVKHIPEGKQDPAGKLQFYNGYGGFTNDGAEYCILVQPDPASGLHRLPPAPWINTVANPSFGFLSTESGAGYTWSVNSRENKLTSWSNDPVLDPPSEAFYIRDEVNNTYWSPTPEPVPGELGYEVYHGFGYTRYNHRSFGIESELFQFVPLQDPVRISGLTIKNNSEIKRKLSLFSYQEWVMGVAREASSRHVFLQVTSDRRSVFARNHYNNEFAGRTAFAACSGETDGITLTTNRQNFIGRNRSLNDPLSVEDCVRLDSEAVAGGDPCAAFQMEVELESGEEFEWIILLGETTSREEAVQLIEKYVNSENTEDAFNGITAYWKQLLGTIRVETPEPSLDVVMNGWLMYQNIACRMWARTAFYQAGGAYGYRDQLQDAMAALYVDPAMTREQILLHASRQFPEGDVQHWWHPPTGRGIRSRISDDRLWLPYVVDFYIESTGDKQILEERIPYLNARMLEDHEHDAYLQPEQSHEEGNLYDHCVRAIEISLETGEHGLPLIGTGDWNDGMDRVGHKGKGESVWLGFFIHTILKKFIRYSKMMDDGERTERYGKEAKKLARHLNGEGWDGDWYIRAFYDDGTPLGSAQNDECRIDALSQSWSVISGVATQSKAVKALNALDQYLVSEKDGIIRLLTPPFDRTEHNPGYIKGYIPGVRENGGQYTHAALWAIKAFAEAGFGKKAVKYLQMINPVNHALTKNEADRYKVEPYVAAADVYGEPPLTGQGGWTWYTGSAGWMYRVALESILGIRYRNNTLIIRPAVSPEWSTWKVHIKLSDAKTMYHVEVRNPSGLETGNLEGTIDGEEVRFDHGKARVKLKNDGKEHSVNLRFVPEKEMKDKISARVSG